MDASAYWISVTCCPAISVPAGFTAEGLPVGLQIVGRRRDDLGVLQIAYAFEQATGFGRMGTPLASNCTMTPAQRAGPCGALPTPPARR